MRLKVVLIRARDGKRFEMENEYTTPERVRNSFDLFYPKPHKAYAIYDTDGNLLYSRGEV